VSLLVFKCDNMGKKSDFVSSDHLHHLTFDNSMLANIVSVVDNGSIIAANKSAVKLLGYSKKTLLTKSISDLFMDSKDRFKQLSSHMEKDGHAVEEITLLKKDGKSLPCQVTSVRFTGEDHIQKAITTLVDRHEVILRQKNIDIIKDKKLDKEKTEIGELHMLSRLRQIEFDKQWEVAVKLKEVQIADAIAAAKELERSDIGKELHDNVNQLLVASSLYVQMARKNIAYKDIYLTRSSEYILSAIEEIRKLTKGLITDAVNSVGLCDALEHITRDLMEVYPLKISRKMDDNIQARLTPKFNINVFRIVQEQLNNIIKHARATVVKIRLFRNKNGVVLSVVDNGVGFDISKKPEGIGFMNIKSRVASYEGKTRIVSKTGKGCALTITFPTGQSLLANAAAVK
jgi:PAS domain S-box-containing protein